MAFSLKLISLLMCLNFGYHAAVAHPSGPQPIRPPQPNTPDSQGPDVAKSAAKLSPPCQLAASGLVTGEFGTCANIIGLVSILEAKESIVAPIDAWVSGACSSAPCSKEGLATASQTIKTGCAADLKEGSVTAVAMYSILTHYDVTRDMFCTQYKSNSTFCLPYVLGNVESQSGEKMTLGEMISLITGKFTKADRSFMAVPTSAYCNPCGQAIVGKSAIMIDAIRKDPVGIPFNYTSSEGVHVISDICGPSFEDKQLPNVVQIAQPKAGKPADKTDKPTDKPTDKKKA
ncbi:hypothetical protein MJO28_006722 [Puccinia striiformis f. sp. tritici]|uniref:Killer toxin Kp4 domain-containing protein n=2 Tax=Puccinia striiformis f. sp. tritici TaxID=168172 RepID=A0A0L0VL88_9BASI|nr:hypothetical protein Pst134EB_012851 [Puccinia striiformis f. sp. tritici]KAI7954175.1 hypothetical protein MJO28_006722 [Puccinia striiformis f. sp. tritici]KAI7958478.1 hypothetical protein MJO29_006695 [Puccinia striiformis f. sp. tritici]KNF00026.1 hypothetical protein PSTG_06649 [Puccinia striiformis f. sp. tritici PST-78]